MTYDLINKIYKPTGTMLVEDGIEYPEMEQVVGYHVNVLPPMNDTTDIEGTVIVNPLKAYVVEVNTPTRVFGGRSDMICLKFASRAEWLSMNIEVEEEIV
jgi:hypothetical protein